MIGEGVGANLVFGWRQMCILFMLLLRSISLITGCVSAEIHECNGEVWIGLVLLLGISPTLLRHLIWNL